MDFNETLILAKKMKDKKSGDTHLLHLVYNREGGGNVATSCLVLRSMEEREQTNWTVQSDRETKAKQLLMSKKHIGRQNLNFKNKWFMKRSDVTHKMNCRCRNVLLTLCHLFVLISVGVQANPDAKRLYDDLLSGYNRLVNTTEQRFPT